MDFKASNQGRENVKVAVRIRPTGNFAEKNVLLGDEGNYVEIYQPKDKTQPINNQQERWGFTFDSVLNNASQSTVFDVCASDIVASALDGFNGTIMAYVSMRHSVYSSLPSDHSQVTNILLI